MAEYIKSRSSGYLLNINGFLYYKNGGTYMQRTYWLCKNAPECNARATTDGGPDHVQLRRGSEDDHNHAPDTNAALAEKVQASIKRRAMAHPEAPPAQVLRTELRNVPSGKTEILVRAMVYRRNIQK